MGSLGVLRLLSIVVLAGALLIDASRPNRGGGGRRGGGGGGYRSGSRSGSSSSWGRSGGGYSNSRSNSNSGWGKRKALTGAVVGGAAGAATAGVAHKTIQKFKEWRTNAAGQQEKVYEPVTVYGNTPTKIIWVRHWDDSKKIETEEKVVVQDEDAEVPEEDDPDASWWERPFGKLLDILVGIIAWVFHLPWWVLFLSTMTMIAIGPWCCRRCCCCCKSDDDDGDSSDSDSDSSISSPAPRVVVVVVRDGEATVLRADDTDEDETDDDKDEAVDAEKGEAPRDPSATPPKANT